MLKSDIQPSYLNVNRGQAVMFSRLFSQLMFKYKVVLNANFICFFFSMNKYHGLLQIPKL